MKQSKQYMKPTHKHIHTGFKTPDTYFDSFEHKLYEELHIKPQTGFTHPVNYFDNLQNNILKTAPTETPVRRLINIKQLAYISAVAASLVFCFYIFKPTDLQQISFEDVEYASYENYLITEDLNISSEELVELLNLSTKDFDGMSFSTLEDDTITEYLSDSIETEFYFNN
ncbi:MAG: hypothetical protein ACPGRW_05950, partial [Flavobacteriaceae bacterium]